MVPSSYSFNGRHSGFVNWVVVDTSRYRGECDASYFCLICTFQRVFVRIFE